MPTRNVVLTDHQEAFIGDAVATGRFKNASEVLREGLRLVEQREAEDALRLKTLRTTLDEAEACVEAGDIADYSSSLLDDIDAEELAEFSSTPE